LAVVEGGPGGSNCAGELMEVQPDGSLLPIIPKPTDPPAIPQEPAASNETEPAPTPEALVPANGPEPIVAPAPDPSASVPRAP
jgi:hypothetical protein